MLRVGRPPSLPCYRRRANFACTSRVDLLSRVRPRRFPMRMQLFRSLAAAAVALFLTAPSSAQWHDHTVQLLNGPSGPLPIPAKIQIVSEPWKRVVAVPYIVHMPEKQRLLMLVGCDYPHHPEVLHSDDEGNTWSATCGGRWRPGGRSRHLPDLSGRGRGVVPYG